MVLFDIYIFPISDIDCLYFSTLHIVKCTGFEMYYEKE
jgi:hypothetical protein